MTFYEKCLKLASKCDIDTETDSKEIPERYVVPTQALIDIMKKKMSILDQINIPFIETVFDDIDKAIETLNEKTEDGDVPDGIINKLSSELYGSQIKELTKEQQAIIKVLSCYLCIQN